MSIIIRAIKEGQRELAMKLISNALPYQTCLYDDDGQTALHLAIQKNYLDLAQKLLEKGANINAFASDVAYGYMTPLHYAALTGNNKATELLITWGANRNLENKQKQTAYNIAYQHDYLEIARMLGNQEKFSRYQWPAQTPEKAFVPFNPKPLVTDNVYRMEPSKGKNHKQKFVEYGDNVIDFLSYKRAKRHSIT